MTNILYLVLSLVLIISALEIGMTRGSQLISKWNKMDYLAYTLLWLGVLSWAVFVCKFLLWLFS